MRRAQTTVVSVRFRGARRADRTRECWWGAMRTEVQGTRISGRPSGQSDGRRRVGRRATPSGRPGSGARGFCGPTGFIFVANWGARCASCSGNTGAERPFRRAFGNFWTTTRLRRPRGGGGVAGRFAARSRPSLASRICSGQCSRLWGGVAATAPCWLLPFARLRTAYDHRRLDRRTSRILA